MPSDEAGPSGHRRLLLSWRLALPGCGNDEEKGQDPFAKVDPQITKVKDRAAPRWEPIAVMRGTGPEERRSRSQSAPSSGALAGAAGRASCPCRSRPSRARRPERPGGRCPGKGAAEWIQSGAQRLKVKATGRWRVIVEQQVDTPLQGAAAARDEVEAAPRCSPRGNFYPIERRGKGRVALYRLPSGRLALRFEDFNTSSNTDLFVWLSKAARPKTTTAAVKAPQTGGRAQVNPREPELRAASIGERGRA